MSASATSSSRQSAPLDDADEYPTHAFLVHSHSSLAQDLPPALDTSISTRQKRRRTSPHDQAILEAAYLRNSKPDKNERADIVSRVSLGEKEVQIWFQNRRQNDRRRSRPLLPHELVPHFRNDVPREVFLKSLSTKESSASDESSYPPHAISEPSSLSQSSHLHINDLLHPPSSSEDQVTSSMGNADSGAEDNQTTPPSSFERPQHVCLPDTPVNSQPDPSEGQQVEQMGSGKKRSHDEISGMENESINETPQNPSATNAKCHFVRLSMTTEGAVKVRTCLEDTPSPPKERAQPPPDFRIKTGLQRSKSAVESGTLSAGSLIDQSSPRVLDRNFGRSRDARTWEFYCDSSARDALSSHAETERSGSAVGAINLIRSQSQKSKRQALTPQLTKVNSRLGVSGVSSGKPKLSRAKSSMGRLQGLGVSIDPDLAKSDRPGFARSPSGDSDKENWAPGTRISTHPLRRIHANVGRRDVLQTTDTLRSVSGSGVGDENLCGPSWSKAQEFNAARHKAAGRGDMEKDKGEDLDCVQGLLSLSQGAWK